MARHYGCIVSAIIIDGHTTASPRFYRRNTKIRNPRGCTMRYAMLILPERGRKLPTSKELRMTGFAISSAMDKDGETQKTRPHNRVKEKDLPPPAHDNRQKAAEETKQ
ncbi:MAG: hypothetical protein JEY79_16915 [Pseudodesulfovibrio sp.]|nr:hypothetical protein [Pseudodesulfovibrio sp.]